MRSEKRVLRRAFLERLIPLSAHGPLGREQDVVVVPDGEVRLKRGPTLVLDAAGAAEAMERFQQQGVDLPFDLEHALMVRAPEGLGAPACGWADRLWYEPGRGLMAHVRWTDAGYDDIRNYRYRYLSPVMYYEEATGRIVEIHSVALTNKPAIESMPALAASEVVREEESDAMTKLATGAELGGDQNPGNGGGAGGEGGGGSDATSQVALLDSLKELVAAVRSALGLAEDAGSEQILEAIRALKEPKGEGGGEVAASLRETLKLPADADARAIVAAVEKQAAHVGYVPAEQHNAVVERVAALEKANADREAEDLVAGCVATGKLNKADEPQMAWARKTATSDPEGFKVIMANAPVLIPQGRTTPPAGGAEGAGRTAVIAASAQEYRGDSALQGLTSMRAYVDECLRDKGQAALSEKEAGELVTVG